MSSSDLAPSVDVDNCLERLAAGGRLTGDELTRLASSPDILPIGVLADTIRRRGRGTTTTYLRVTHVDVAKPVTSDALSPSAHDVRLSGVAESFGGLLDIIARLDELAGSRTLSGFSWTDVERWASEGGGTPRVLAALRQRGLDTLGEIPLDQVDDLPGALNALADAGFQSPRLTVSKAAPVPERVQLFMRVAEVVARFPDVAAIAPLPMSLNPLRPTTGYDDVKAVAVARLAMPDVPRVQVDWLRYGPKLAQVALTFGADDIDNVSASDDTPDGRRRGTIEELRKNIESAAFSPVERDGYYRSLA